MINFKPITPSDKSIYTPYLMDGTTRGCEFSFANLCMWGRQSGTILHDHLVLFSQFNRRSVYPYPVGTGDKKAVLDAIIADSKERGIPCRITGLNAEAIETLNTLYPSKFRFHADRDSFDYVYEIDKLSSLSGKKYQAKRNHINRFREAYPNYRVEALNDSNLSAVMQMAENWYEQRISESPDSDFHMEKAALTKAFRHYQELGMEGLLLWGEDKLLGEDNLLAFTLGSALSLDTFDIHFEKAFSDVQGAYPIINQEFALYLKEKYPNLVYLDREEDMGIEGLRKSKLSYHPHHLVEKQWACLLEDEYEY